MLKQGNIWKRIISKEGKEYILVLEKGKYKRIELPKWIF